MTRSATIESRLRAELSPQDVEVVDESHLHVGHAGARDGGGHFRVTIVASRFTDLDKVSRHRLVYAALHEMMGTEIHALSIFTSTPDEL